MKKLIILLLLLATSYTSFCQTATETASSDSIVVLPKQLVTYMVQDLIRFDGLKLQMQKADQNVNALTKQVEAQGKLNDELRNKLRSCEATNSEYQTIDELNTRTIESLKGKSAKMKRQRNTFIYFSAAMIVALIVK